MSKQADLLRQRGYLPVKEAADLLGVAQGTIYNYLQGGKIKGFQLGPEDDRSHGRWYVLRTSLVEFLGPGAAIALGEGEPKAPEAALRAPSDPSASSDADAPPAGWTGPMEPWPAMGPSQGASLATSLFGHMATRFGAHPENLATEALGYVLRRSQAARDALAALVAHAGVSLPPGLRFVNQVVGAEDGARPDLVGRGADGAEPLVIEAKFWAGLTDSQPVAYLRRLPAAAPGALLVVAPAKRLELIWSELLRRCREAQVDVHPTARAAGLFSARTGRHHALVLTSWRAVLDAVDARLGANGDRAGQADVAQLQGLCDRMDADAFLPIQPEELTSGAFRRVIEFSQLVEDVAARALGAGLCDQSSPAHRGKLKAVAGLGYYGRYLYMHGCGVMLQFNVYEWMRLRSTPLWLKIYGYDWKNWQPAAGALSEFQDADPPRLLRSLDDRLVVPLFPPTGVERDDVVAALVEQVAEVSRRLEKVSGLASSGTAAEPPPSDGAEAMASSGERS